MKIIKPSIPKGTRDFSPAEMIRRNHIFSAIKKVFEKCGFLSIETPAIENIETLTGKYGEAGDRLIFKILARGQKLKDAISRTKETDTAVSGLSEEALRYDLTVPFARYVVQHQNDIVFPFKRYQIQPVWRADKPQKGRYREFYQCDADVIGSDALLNEVELVQIMNEVFVNLRIENISIRLNNRKILSGIAESLRITDKFSDMTTAIDKLDTTGMEGVKKELESRGITGDILNKIINILQLSGNNENKILKLKEMLSASEIGKKGIAEMEEILNYAGYLGIKNVCLDITLARGLDYYTGTIFEVVTDSFHGSLCGGGRYDDLTGIFGLNGISGVGISFGADRIYDVMLEKKLFPEQTASSAKLMFVNFGKDEEKRCMKLLAEVRKTGISAELYPEPAKMKKQMKYADAKGIRFVALLGAEEIKNDFITLKNMQSGEQQQLKTKDLIKLLLL